MARSNYAKGAVRREEILDAALRTIAESGYNAVTIRSIAEQAGLSKTGVVHHFSTKHELLTEILERRDDWGGAVGTGADDPGNFFDRLRRSLDNGIADPALLELYVRLAAEATEPGNAAHDFFARRYQIADEYGVESWRHLQEVGRAPRSVDTRHLSLILMAVLDGLQLRLLYEPDLDLEAIIDVFQGVFEKAAAAERHEMAADESEDE